MGFLLTGMKGGKTADNKQARSVTAQGCLTQGTHFRTAAFRIAVTSAAERSRRAEDGTAGQNPETLRGT